jgi:hypothetical protein
MPDGPLRVSGEPMVVTASLDGTAAIWNILTGELFKHLKGGHTSAITCVDTFVPSDNRSPIAITGSADRSIVVWHLRRGEKLRHFPDVSQEPVAAINIFSDLDGISPIVIISDKKTNLQIRDLYPSTFMPNRDDVLRSFEADAEEPVVSVSREEKKSASKHGKSGDDDAASDGTENWQRIAKLSAKYQIGFWLEHGFLFAKAIEDNRVDFLVKFKDMLKESLYSLRGVHSLLRVAIEKNSADCVQIVADCWIACLPSTCRDMGSQLFWHPSHFLTFEEIKELGTEFPNICSELVCSLSLISSNSCTLSYLKNAQSVADLETSTHSSRSGRSGHTKLQPQPQQQQRRRSVSAASSAGGNSFKVLPMDGSNHSGGSDPGATTSVINKNAMGSKNAALLEMSAQKVDFAFLGPSRQFMTGMDNTLATKIPGMWSTFLLKIAGSTASGQPVIPQFLPLQGAASLEMLALFNEISDELDSPDIFDSTAGSLCLQYAWESVGWSTHLTMLVSYVLFVLLYSVAIFGFEWLRRDDHPFIAWALQIAVLARIGLYFATQLIELFSDRAKYFANPALLQDFFAGNVWVMMDWASSVLVVRGMLLRVFHNDETTYSRCILAIASVFIWFKILYYMRAYEGSGPLVAMILRIGYDIRYFTLILGLVMTGFTQAFWLICNVDPTLDFGTIDNAFMNSFLYLLGGFQNEFSTSVSPQLAAVLLALYMFFMAILMLNLLIALMGETFSNVSEKKIPQWRWEQAVIILEERKLLNTLGGYHMWLGSWFKSNKKTRKVAAAKDDNVSSSGEDNPKDDSSLIHVLQYSGDVFNDDDTAASIGDIHDDIVAMSASVDARLVNPLIKMDSKVDSIKEDFSTQLSELKTEMAELKNLLLSLGAKAKKE